MKPVIMKSKLSLAMIALCAAGVIGSTGALAADTANVAVSATVTGNCKFNSGGTVAFTLDPASTSNATGSVTQPEFYCTKGTSYSITDNDGLYVSTGVQRMRHATVTTEFIPYSFTYTANGTGTGKGTPISMNIASTVANADFINASAGVYADTVVLSINP